jgi:Flp pilus assembly pilin Flp
VHHALAFVLALEASLERFRRRSGQSRESGQATVEYALVVLAAATIAILLVTWAAQTGRLSALFDRVMDLVSAKAE